MVKIDGAMFIIALVIFGLVMVAVLPQLISDMGNETKFDPDGNLSGGESAGVGATLLRTLLPILLGVVGLVMLLKQGGIMGKGKK